MCLENSSTLSSSIKNDSFFTRNLSLPNFNTCGVHSVHSGTPDALRVLRDMLSVFCISSFFLKDKYLYLQKENRKGTPANKLSAAADGFLQQIKSDIGEKNFSILMLDNGEATLMFATDTTGSMGPEIVAAKAIATSIINMQRQFDVDYILSPFSDPSK